MAKRRRRNSELPIGKVVGLAYRPLNNSMPKSKHPYFHEFKKPLTLYYDGINIIVFGQGKFTPKVGITS